MKRFLAYLMIIIGMVIAVAGLAGTPLVQDLLPIDLMLPADNQAKHYCFRVVPAEPHAADYLPYVLLLLGLAIFIAGLVLHRKFRGIAA